MGWEDRPYYRDSSAPSNPILRVLYGSVPLFTVFGIRVRAHAFLIIFVLLTILLNFGVPGFGLVDRVISMAFWVAIVMLHEFGHCFAARWIGGTAHEVVLQPLGGVAYTDHPRSASAQFIVSAAGPAVNLVMFVAAAIGLYWSTPTAETLRFVAHPQHLLLPLNPFALAPTFFTNRSEAAFYWWFLYIINYITLLINLLPIYPLDGGQMTQAVLWPLLGHFRSMMVTTAVGMGASVVAAIACLVAPHGVGVLFSIIFVFCFVQCYRQRLLLRESGPEDWRDSVDYGAALFNATEDKPKRRRVSRRALNRARRIAAQEKAARDQIDSILAKVSAKGMVSLTWRERRTLRRATERQRRSEVELSRFQ
jgi:stage IV sporulation protein FB